jgi:23S rRNA pseudouridine1911/1915/1917 synthase
VNKKQGMVTHPACGNWHGTLANALLYFWQNQDELYSKDKMSCSNRPGIVHRLDKDTTGTIIAAKNPEIETYLQEQFKTHRIKKEYIAIVEGMPPKKHGSIKTNIMRDPKNRKKFIVTDDKAKGKTAKTIYTCIACYGPYSLMRIRLKTGRTHQIRVHLKSIGCTIVGDPIYGKPDKNLSGATLMLHARLLSLRLPGNEHFSEFKADIPRRFKKVLKYLHEHYPKRTIIEDDF